MIRCDKCGTFYEELTHSNCPKCGEKAHQSVGRCLLCGKEAERGDVCQKCIKDYQIKAEEIMNAHKEAEGIKYKTSKVAGRLETIAVIIIIATIFGVIVSIYSKADIAVIIAELFGGFLSSVLIDAFAEHLEYMEHMTKQLEEIKEVIKLK